MKGRVVECSVFLFFVIVLFLPPAQGADKLRFGVSAKNNASYMLPVMAAEEKGFFKQQGLEETTYTFAAAAPTYQALVGGSLDMGMGGTLGEIQANARGVPTLMVADLGCPQLFYLWVKADNPIKNPAELKGKKVGITRFGGLVHAYGLMLAKRFGLEGQIRFVSGGGTREEAAAIKTGGMDARIGGYYSTSPLKAKGELREFLLAHDYLPKEWIDVSIFAKRDFAREKPEAVKRALKAIFQGGDFVMKSRDWTKQKLIADFGYTPELADEIQRDQLRYGKDGKINRQALENVRNFIIEHNIMPKEKVPPLERLYDPRFTE